MQLNITIDDELIREAQRVTGLNSERDVLEYSLRSLIRLEHTGTQQPRQRKNPIAALLESDFVGCAETDDTKLSQNYKAELTAILEKKHGYR